MALERYESINKNKSVAGFLTAKRIPAEFSRKDRTRKLWIIHDRCLRDFRKKKGNGDTQGFGNPEKSLLDLKIELAGRMIRSCEFCERRCKVDRKTKKGFCNVGYQSFLSSEFLHMGEESCLIPSHTFFFLGCNFHCRYCQNWTISRQVEAGVPAEPGELAEIAERRGDASKNINLVGGDPIPHALTILRMLKCLNINKPIVWNSNMYMSSELMQLLDGVIDVYLADFKYGNDECAKKLSNVPNYWDNITRNHLLAKDQAEMIVRHLVLPGHIECCSRRVLEWIGRNLGDSVAVNVMDQYHPEYEIYEIKEMSRRVYPEEMDKAFAYARRFRIRTI